MTNENERILKDAQYRKGLSIAFFNATNSAVALVATRQVSDREEAIKEVVRIRDFFLEEHKNYYATVIANVGLNFEVKETLEKFKSVKSLENLKLVWLSLTADERQNEEVAEIKNKLKAKYEKS